MTGAGFEYPGPQPFEDELIAERDRLRGEVERLTAALAAERRRVTEPFEKLATEWERVGERPGRHAARIRAVLGDLDGRADGDDR